MYIPDSVCLYAPASQTTAIVVYTSWERHALVGTDVRLSCSFFSWKWTSPDVTFSWHYRPDGAKDSIAVRRNANAETHYFNTHLQLFWSTVMWKKLFKVIVNPKNFNYSTHIAYCSMELYLEIFGRMSRLLFSLPRPPSTFILC